MAEHRDIPEPGELVYVPRPSWLPATFGFAIALVVCGIFAEGFLVRGWVYSIIGGLVALFALRAMIGGAVGDFFRLRRKQQVRGAVLPVEKIKAPKKI